MLRLPAIWLLCLGLVLTRLLGLHVHACAGIEGTPHDHEQAHVADSGLLFGEVHKQDHKDNVELKAPAVVASAQFFLDASDDPVLPAADLSPTPLTSGWMTVRTSRGPPAARETRPAYFVPPLRGPPTYSLA